MGLLVCFALDGWGFDFVYLFYLFGCVTWTVGFTVRFTLLLFGADFVVLGWVVKVAILLLYLGGVYGCWFRLLYDLDWWLI